MASEMEHPDSTWEASSNYSQKQASIYPIKEDRVDESELELVFGSFEDPSSPANCNDEMLLSKSMIETYANTVTSLSESSHISSSFSQQKFLTKEQIAEQFIEMANFRAKHRRSSLGLSAPWKDAAKKASHLVDPWLDFKLDQYPEEFVIRHDYDPIRRVWNKHEISIKIESKPFGNGSMRQCFRLKKLDKYSSNQDWDSARNCVAKRYLNDVPHTRYFDDVMMQMMTKLWAENFNRHHPPKKVDIIQMSVLEFINRADRPYYHLEGFIEGTYTKYNSNSGFVCDDILRHTPQAFSHFTFEASCHQQIVVDIQGVGDLYTDPQIHTNMGTEYGDGNLGIRGMALFFFTHECNPICEKLELSRFDLSTIENERLLRQHLSSPAYVTNSSAPTACRNSDERGHFFSPGSSLFRRLSSQSSEDGVGGHLSIISSSASSLVDRAAFATQLDDSVRLPHRETASSISNSESILEPNSPNPIVPRVHTRSESESIFKIDDLDKLQTTTNYFVDHRPSSYFLEKAMIEIEQEKYPSILGQIHLEICRCYQIGRFCELGADPFDGESAYFHLKIAAELQVKDAVFALAKIYLDLPRDLLTDYSLPNREDLFSKGMQLMLCASTWPMTGANLILAQLYDKGVEGILQPDWRKAADFYEKYIHLREAEVNSRVGNHETNSEKDEADEHYCSDGRVSLNNEHEIVARLATMYRFGENGLECDYSKAGILFNQAAEMASAIMKGRLANKYYESAEEAFALIPDENI